MMVLFANSGPYLNRSDDVLAQFCQFSLTFALTIGLLEKASDSFQDAVFGNIKTYCCACVNRLAPPTFWISFLFTVN